MTHCIRRCVLRLRTRAMLARGRADAGFTLVEVSVAIVIFAVIGATVMNSFLSGSNAIVRSDARNRSTEQLTNTMNQLTKVFQSAYRLQDGGKVLPEEGVPFWAGSPAVQRTPTNSGVEATFYADLGNAQAPAIVHWYVDADLNLVQEVLRSDESPARPGWEYTKEAMERRVLASNVVLPSVGERPLFSWFSSASNVALNFTDPYKALTDSKGTDIAGVQISLMLKADNKADVKPAAENFVALPAVMFDLTEGPSWPSSPTNPAPLPEGTCDACGGLHEPEPPAEDQWSGGDVGNDGIDVPWDGVDSGAGSGGTDGGGDVPWDAVDPGPGGGNGNGGGNNGNGNGNGNGGLS